MIGHGGDRQAKALDSAIRVLQHEPCEDAVSRKEIQQKINRLWNSNGDKDYCMETLRDFVTELPPVKPTRKRGKWIKEYDNSALDGLYHCSVCGRKLWIHKEESVSDYPYCHCGSRNEVE